MTEALPNQLFRVQLSDGRMVTAHVADRLKVPLVRLVKGEEVMVEISEFDPNKGRITGKMK